MMWEIVQLIHDNKVTAISKAILYSRICLRNEKYNCLRVFRFTLDFIFLILANIFMEESLNCQCDHADLHYYM